MPKKKEKFIDKKNSVTFHLVHRSQQDPLAADEKAPQKVLLPVNTQSKGDKKKQIEEQQKYGIYFEDGYNYLQHLRDTDKTMEWEKVERIPAAKPPSTKLNLPSSVFASTVEEEVGLLNRAAPESGLRLDLDPDVVAAMDDDFDFDDPDNQLEDNFMELANAPASEEENDATSDVDSNFSAEDIDSNADEDEERDEIRSLQNSQFSFDEEETKTRFTEYSMSSSVMRRNDQLTLLDSRFEKMYAGYDENEIGALDCEEIEGHVPENSDLLLQYAEEFEKSRRTEQLDEGGRGVRVAGVLCSDEEELVEVEVPQKVVWDCQSILSTYSDIYNHPKLICEPKQEKIKVNMRTGLPQNVLGANKLTARALARLDGDFAENRGPRSVAAESISSRLSTLSIRPKDESAEERRERKKLLKEYKRERRVEKKVNKGAFKEEAKRQAKIAVNNRNNVQGNRLL